LLYQNQTTMEKLSATTKELIFNRIEELKKNIATNQNFIQMMQERGTKEFIQYHTIETQMMQNEIETLKQLLFNN